MRQVILAIGSNTMRQNPIRENPENPGEQQKTKKGTQSKASTNNQLKEIGSCVQ